VLANAVVIASAGASDSWLLASDFCFSGYNRKSTGYSAVESKIGYQAGMSKGMSDVRSYVGLHAANLRKRRELWKGRPGKVGNTRTRPECPKR
jgi:hypothetical protein